MWQRPWGKIIAYTSLIKKQKKEKLGELQLDLKEEV